ncbi:MAG: CBS domain-containing protein [Sphingobacteriaceae bacterium]
MLAGELINPGIKPLRPSDSVQKALDRMAEFRLAHLPLVNGQQFMGLVSDESLIDIADHTRFLKELETTLLNFSIQAEQHVYELLKLVGEHQLDGVAVINQDKNYLGFVTQKDIIASLSTLTSVKEPGSIMVLSISNRDNSLAHIAQIVESDHAEILSSYVRSFPDSTRMEITLKLNRTDISSIIAAFERYNYTVAAIFNDGRLDQDNSDRYDQLMNYLDL